MNAICLVLDRLHTGFLGAYGNTWIETPSFDRLAWESVVFDQMLIDSPRLDTLYRSLWHGNHALAPPAPADRPTLPGTARDAGIHTALITDEHLVAAHSLAGDFEEIIDIDPPWTPSTADTLESTHLAQCFAQLISWLEGADDNFLLWSHLAGLGTAWDAPHAFREMVREEGDPEPPPGAEVPSRMLPADHDPDELLGITQAYAGQIALVDACLGALLEFLDDSPHGQNTLLVLTSSRGFPLGEHARVGSCDEAIYGELVHVPLMIRLPNQHPHTPGLRSPAMIEPADLWATLLEPHTAQLPPTPTAQSLWPILREEQPATWRDRLCVAGKGASSEQHHGERGIRTPAWYLRTSDVPELFTKPDDRWEINNVADRCSEVVDDLTAVLDQTQQTLTQTQPTHPPLSEVLRDGLE